MVKAELAEFVTDDDLRLPGLLYEPQKKTQKVLIYLHGCGSTSVFYSVRDINIFADALTKAGIAFFPFNNRGAHIVKTLTRRQGLDNEVETLQGTAFEKIKECILDINGSLNFLKKKGFNEFYCIGHSTGANKIVVYDHYVPKNEIKKYILWAGGDDVGLYYREMGSKKFHLALKKSKDMTDKGKGEKLVPRYLNKQVYSYQAFFDILNPDGDYNIFPFNDGINKLNLSIKPLFSKFSKIRKPTLVLYGDRDEYCYGDVKKCVTLLRSAVSGKKNFTFQIIPGADHGFTGKEEELAKMVVNWIK